MFSHLHLDQNNLSLLGKKKKKKKSLTHLPTLKDYTQKI